MSLVLITLPGAPKVSAEAVRREKELEDLIEAKVTGKLKLLKLYIIVHYSTGSMKTCNLDN